jgi:transposase-like protein
MVNTREIAAEYRLSHWSQIMQERVQSGLSVKAYCRQIEISGNTYFYWQRRLREAACEQLALKPNDAHSFAEIKVIEPPALPPPSLLSQIHVEINGYKITADSSYPTESLAALLRELQC